MKAHGTGSSELPCEVCHQPGHVRGIECLDCCGTCGSKKDDIGACIKKCTFKDFWDLNISNGVPIVQESHAPQPPFMIMAYQISKLRWH